MRFSGIAFSGGDCFLVFNRLLAWLAFFRDRFPECYFWAYTNGLRVTEAQLRAVAKLGLDEIRFNTAASGYDSPQVMRLVKTASRLFDHVTVEIPAIPEDTDRVINALPGLARAGIHFLNLHEFFIMENELDSKRGYAGRHLLNEVSELWYDVRSRGAMRKIQDFCRREGMPFRVHLCTLERKDIQMRKRRQVMGRLLRKPWERVAAGGLLETVLALPDSLPEEKCLSMLGEKGGLEKWEHLFVHPARLRILPPHLPGHLFRLFFLPPMDVGGERTLLRSERIN
jgi:pyruvate formate-lyase activating enzyme-like uncharacterized protein